MSKKITSRTGLFGTTVHYDEKGVRLERAVRASSAAKFTTMRRVAR